MSSESCSPPVVIFDGTCGFCSRVVLFILKNDSRGELVFTSNSSHYGSSLLTQHGLVEESRKTIVVVVGERVLVRSDAVLFIAAHLRQPYAWLVAGRVVPRVLRDLVYRGIAAVRYLLASPKDVCELLPPEQQARIKER
jgi:predicted DCC family thiol-disulfide oxidoreductase YuxK